MFSKWTAQVKFLKKTQHFRSYNTKNEILSQIERAKTSREKLVLQNDLGRLYLEENDHELAHKYFLKSSHLLQDVSDTKLNFQTKLFLSQSYGKIHELMKAKDSFSDLINYAETNTPHLLLQAYKEYIKFLTPIDTRMTPAVFKKAYATIKNYQEQSTDLDESERKLMLAFLIKQSRDLDQLQEDVLEEERRKDSKNDENDIRLDVLKHLDLIKNAEKEENDEAAVKHARELLHIIPMISKEDMVREVLYVCAQVFQSRQKVEMSTEIYKQLLNMDPTRVEKFNLNSQLAHIMIGRDDYENAKIYCQVALDIANQDEKRTDSNQLHQMMGYICLHEREWVKSIEFYSQDNSLEEVGKYLGISSAKMLKRHEKDTEMVAKILDTAFSSTATRDVIAAAMQELIDQHPSSDIAAFAYMRLAMMFSGEKNPSEAIENLQKAHDIVVGWSDDLLAENMDLYNTIMKNLLMNSTIRRDWDGNVRTASQMLDFETDPEKRAKWLLGRGVAYYYLNEVNKSIKDVTRSLGFFQKDKKLALFAVKSSFILGKAYEKLADKENAEIYNELARKAIEEEPDLLRGLNSLDLIPLSKELGKTLLKF